MNISQILVYFTSRSILDIIRIPRVYSCSCLERVLGRLLSEVHDERREPGVRLLSGAGSKLGGPERALAPLGPDRADPRFRGWSRALRRRDRDGPRVRDPRKFLPCIFTQDLVL
jgi:hypothetical protein